MPIQVIRPGAGSGFRRRRRLRAKRGSGTQDFLAEALFQGFDSLDRDRDRNFQLELLGEQLSNQLELQAQGQQGTLDVIAAQGTRAETESALDRQLARETNEASAAAQLAVVKEGNAGNLATIKESLGPQFAAIENQGRQITQQGEAQQVNSLAILESLRSQKRVEGRGNIALQRGILENEAQAAVGTAVGDRQKEIALAQQAPETFSAIASEAFPPRSATASVLNFLTSGEEFGTLSSENMANTINDLAGQLTLPGSSPLQRQSAVDSATALRDKLRGDLPMFSFGLESTQTPFIEELDRLLKPGRVAKIRRAADQFRATPESSVIAGARAPFDKQIRENAARGLELGTGGVEGLDAAIQKMQQGIGGQPATNPEIRTPTTPPDLQTTEEVILGPTPGDQVGAVSPLIADIARKIARQNLMQQGLIA